MAYIVGRPSGSWEIRESRATPSGPRARTLATFRSLTPEVLEHARGRSTRSLDAAELRRAALRAGAPVSAGASDRAAGELLAELAAGRPPRPALRLLLLDALRDDASATRPPARTSDGARAAAAWVAATPQRRGQTLRDLLLLVDRLPPGRSGASRRRFPRMRSSPE